MCLCVLVVFTFSNFLAFLPTPVEAFVLKTPPALMSFVLCFSFGGLLSVIRLTYMSISGVVIDQWLYH